MTKEEAKTYLENYRKIYADLAPERFLEALDCILSQPSLPSNLDEVAKKIAYSVCRQLPNGEEKDNIVYYAILAAKAGAEWMAEHLKK